MFLTLFLVIGGGAAVYIALRTNTTAPVAPTVPQSKPRAAGTTTPACTVSFTVATPAAALVCTSVTISPNDGNVSPGAVRQVTASATGGTPPLTYSWSQTSDSTSLGTFSATGGASVAWTAPMSVKVTGQVWTLSALITDSAGATASGTCNTSVTYALSRGCNTPCDTSAECPSGLACSSGSCRNPSCTAQTDCNCPPPPPTPVCNSTCTTNADCPSGLTCSGGSCRNPSCTSSTSCACPVPVATPSPQPAPVVRTYKSCRNNACVTVQGVGKDSCTSDVSCQPPAKLPPIPQSGVDLPTIAVILGGLALVAIGLLAL